MLKEYCKSCTNADTHICKTCTYVETAKGIINPPTEYCWYDVRVLDEIHIRDLAAMIENRTSNNLPIPLRYVIKYNTLLEERYNGETENISAL